VLDTLIGTGFIKSVDHGETQVFEFIYADLVNRCETTTLSIENLLVYLAAILNLSSAANSLKCSMDKTGLNLLSKRFRLLARNRSEMLKEISAYKISERLAKQSSIERQTAQS
jgi:hypothetical protein